MGRTLIQFWNTPSESLRKSYRTVPMRVKYKLWIEQFFLGKDIELHTGFERRYLVSRTVLHKKIERFFPNRKKIVSIGHSLGGALAGICAADLAISLNLNVRWLCSTMTYQSMIIEYSVLDDITGSTENRESSIHRSFYFQNRNLNKNFNQRWSCYRSAMFPLVQGINRLNDILSINIRLVSLTLVLF